MKAAIVQARAPLPAFAVPGAMDAPVAVEEAVGASGLSPGTRELVHVRASQISGHFDEQRLAALVRVIANVNLWNRMNVATRQSAGKER